MRLGLASCVALVSALFVACEPPPPATLEFVDQSPAQPRLGEITTVRFRAVDSRGVPQAGTTVTFKLQPEVPGVEITPEATTNVGDGIASTQLVATGRVASVVVVATAGDKTAVSPAVSFAGSSASGKQFTFQCGEIAGPASGGIHAIGAFDETRYLIAGVKVTCTAHVADRSGDGITGAQVSFITEAGTIGPSSTSTTDVVGNASILYKTSYPLPVETDPGEFTWAPLNDATHTGDYLAPLWMQPFYWTENPIRDYGNGIINPQTNRQEPRRADPLRPGRLNNPRDNLVAMIAVTTGEEGFEDNNNNGQWDPGEPFQDLTEPFVDSNDDGTWNLNERFVDSNADGKWNGKNGVFDASTLIWVQERLLWTGWPHPTDRDESALNPTPIVRQLAPPPGSPVVLQHFDIATATFLLADPWYNGMARNSGNDGCKEGSLGPVIVEPLPTGIAFTYPAFTVERYTFRDEHDPTKEPPPNPYAAPGLPFEVNATCQYTASPEDGHQVLIAAPPIKGRVF